MNETFPSLPAASVRDIAVVGAGRLGRVLARALTAAGLGVAGPLHRGDPIPAVDVAILCVPDAAIHDAARAAHPHARVVGHVSGATGLDDVDFSVHPLQTFTGTEAPSVFHGIGAAIDGRTPETLAVAEKLAVGLGTHPFRVDDRHRAGYHASASIASNLILAVLDAAERVAGSAGIPSAEARAVLAPLVRQTVTNWADRGAAEALTGPIARGDEATVARQRVAVAAGNPELLELVDALTAQTRVLADGDGDGVSSRSARSTTPGADQGTTTGETGRSRA
ncbi:Predicted oxidoreductase, contains short-chain dehydrogenase (SDR) and DUF2520 domains [Microbacterium azadirachtae]|uniref:Predicted oxidoreductase, contains short-chain dehydrogenase (SDR) and DUF2520 domains n=1 Tax=Microbacterium azadirachtae TaxID=582680 RepID=A0A1I6HFX3_9MICO|nr:DUF2520 domain-containing protein [Microbacterium azadirachtae]SFR53244.1 Predicted oxidoreductase, contains short-chain dehydrogenase (SDR) and DUF2520 domains [Microbacterium azadirachtae]